MHEDFHVLHKKDPFAIYAEHGPPRDWGEEIEVEVDAEPTQEDDAEAIDE